MDAGAALLERSLSLSPLLQDVLGRQMVGDLPCTEVHHGVLESAVGVKEHAVELPSQAFGLTGGLRHQKSHFADKPIRP